MDHYHVETLNKVRQDYLIELSCGAFEYIEDHTDQNIANNVTTRYNVLAEMLAGFLLGFPIKQDQVDILQDLVNMVIKRVEFYEDIIKEIKDEE